MQAGGRRFSVSEGRDGRRAKTAGEGVAIRFGQAEYLPRGSR